MEKLRVLGEFFFHKIRANLIYPYRGSAVGRLSGDNY